MTEAEILAELEVMAEQGLVERQPTPNGQGGWTITPEGLAAIEFDDLLTVDEVQ